MFIGYRVLRKMSTTTKFPLNVTFVTGNKKKLEVGITNTIKYLNPRKIVYSLFVLLYG